MSVWMTTTTLGASTFPSKIYAHIYLRSASATLDALECDALTAHDRFEVCGTLRCPCYGLPAEANGGVSNKGFGLFIQQSFAGNAKQRACRGLDPLPIPRPLHR